MWVYLDENLLDYYQRKYMRRLIIFFPLFKLSISYFIFTILHMSMLNFDYNLYKNHLKEEIVILHLHLIWNKDILLLYVTLTLI